MSIALRPATPADAERVAEVLLASRKAFLAFAPSPHSDEDVRTWVRDVLLPSEEVTVAVAESQVVGVLATNQTDGISWITQLYLHPAYVGQGIGSKLLAHLITGTRRPIRLYSFQQNLGARRFYEWNGFVPIQFTDGLANEERCPDVLYELASRLKGEVRPTFGCVPTGRSSRPRRAAYAVIRDREGRVAAVEHHGRYFLPGGGGLAHESPEEAVIREVREELGRAVVILGSVGSAVQHFFASDDKCWYSMDAVFFWASLLDPPVGTAEKETTWLPLDQAHASFFHASHTWAASRA